MKPHVTLALDIRRGILMIAGAIRKHVAVDPSGAASTLAEVLEACGEGIERRFGKNDPRTRQE